MLIDGNRHAAIDSNCRLTSRPFILKSGSLELDTPGQSAIND